MRTDGTTSESMRLQALDHLVRDLTHLVEKLEAERADGASLRRVSLTERYLWRALNKVTLTKTAGSLPPELLARAHTALEA